MLLRIVQGASVIDSPWHAKAATALRGVAAVQNLAEILKAQKQRASVVECGDAADAAERSLRSHRFGVPRASIYSEAPEDSVAASTRALGCFGGGRGTEGEPDCI